MVYAAYPDLAPVAYASLVPGMCLVMFSLEAALACAVPSACSVLLPCRGLAGSFTSSGLRSDSHLLGVASQLLSIM